MVLDKLFRKNSIFYIFVILSLLSSILAVDYSKHSNILASEKLNQSRVEDMTELEEVERRIFENKENTIIVFHADWCHHCKEFIPVFEEASKYKLAAGFNFMTVNCQNKNICNQFDVKHYPTVKFYIEGHKSSEEPGRDVASILEFIQKLTSPAIIELQSEGEVANFRTLYGEDIFVVYYDGDKNSQWYKCIEQLAEKKFKPNFYFGLYNNQSNASQAIVYNEKYGIRQEWNGSCLEIENFIESNLFPIIRKLDSNYIKKIQKENKKLFMAAVSIKNSVHMYFIENILAEVSVKNRIKKGNYVFAFIDIDLDAYLINYFKIDLNKLPRIIIYDFDNKRYYVDNFLDETTSQNEEISFKHLNELIEKAEQPDALSWTTGNFFEDILAKFGIRLNQTGIIYLVAGLFVILAVFFLIAVFYCGEKNEEEEAKKLSEQELVKKEDASKVAHSDKNHTKCCSKEPIDKKNQ